MHACFGGQRLISAIFLDCCPPYVYLKFNVLPGLPGCWIQRSSCFSLSSVGIAVIFIASMCLNSGLNDFMASILLTGPLLPALHVF